MSFAASFNDESPFLVTRHKVIRIAGVCALFYCTFVIGMAHAGTGASTQMDWFSLTMGLVGGLAIFLFGMEQMSTSLKLVAGDKMKTILRKLSGNRFAGVGTGAVTTAVVQSSSVTTVLVVGFISAGLMTLPQALGVILGANIGTTITAQIIAFKVTKYALLMVAIGFTIFFASKKQKTKQWGLLLLGLGLVFYGMTVMGGAMKPLRSFQPFLDLMISMQNAYMAIAVAAIFTALVQSSSATTGIVIVMATEGLLTLEAGIALALGANIGTCVTAGLAAIGKPREAVRAAAAHTVFNVVGVVLIAPFVGPFAQLIASLPAEATATGSSIPRQIANAHTVFNIGMTLAFLPFLGPIGRALTRFIPDAKKDDKARTTLHESLLSTPYAAISQARRELAVMAEIASLTIKDFLEATKSEERLEELKEKSLTLAGIHLEISEYLSKLAKEDVAQDIAEDILSVLTVTTSIKNASSSLVHTCEQLTDRKRLFNDDETRRLYENFLEAVAVIFDLASTSFVENDPLMARESLSRIPAANMLETIAQKRNVEMLRSSAETDTIVFSQQFEVLEAIERVLLHSGHIAQRSPGWIQPAVDEKAVLEPTTDEKAVLEPTADEKAA